MEQVIESDRVVRFACITCGDDQTCSMGNGDERFTTLGQLQPQTNSLPWKLLRDDWQQVIQHSKESNQTALAPMLRFAKQVEIVDPYLDPTDKRAIAFLTLVSHLLHRKLGTQVPSTVKIHTSLEPLRITRNDWKK